MTSDLDLLRRFARENSQDAFTEIVRRHLNLVYSAALRQVRSPQLAEEIAQSVFADLARNAKKLKSDTILTAWIYSVTRLTAIDVIRKESRRRLREQIAVEMTNMNATANDWPQIEPLLDDAMAALDETDRSAILLRYFENKTLCEVGESLKISDDAAQKRVSRAVEKLREFFSKQKITVAASGLAVLISANAVQSAPIGLAATISAAAVLAGTAVKTSTMITASKTIAMTTLQKTIIAATFTAAIGTGIYEAHQAAELQNQIQTLQQRQSPLAEQIQQLQRERDDAKNQLAALQAENEQLQSNPNETELLKLRGEVAQLKIAAGRKENDPTESAVEVLVARVSQMKQRLEQMPWQKIPELQLLSAEDYLREASLFGGDLNTDADFDRALAELRSIAKQKFADSMGAALDDYIAANNGQLPNDIADLKSYFNPPVDDAMFQRYQLLQTGKLGDLSQTDSLIAEKAPVNNQHDTLITIGAFGYHYVGVGTWGGSGTEGFRTDITDKIKPFVKQ
jgi:RNA polymerase sigma factor (sigma-70 family)